MSNQVNVDFVTRQIEVDTDGKEHFISAAMAAKDAEQSMLNAQNAANTAEKIATDLGLVDEAVQTAVSSATTASNKADIATAKADIATNKANEANVAATTATSKADAASTSATNAAQSYANADAIATQLTEYLATKETLTAPAVDKTLLIEGAAADSKVVGELKEDLVNYIYKEKIISRGNELGWYALEDGQVVGKEHESWTRLHLTKPFAFNSMRFTIGTQIKCVFVIVNGIVSAYEQIGTYDINISEASDVYMNFFGSSFVDKYCLYYGYKPYESGYINFQVKVNQNIVLSNNTEAELKDYEEESSMHNVTCHLKLPTTYRPYGKKTRLLMVCHGAGRGVTVPNPEDNGTWEDNTNYNALIDTFVNAGYAIFDCNGYKEDFWGCNFWGAHRGVECWRKAYDYIIKNYNVEENVSIYGFSMGGLTALNLVMNGFPNVKVVALGSPVLDPQKAFENGQAVIMGGAYGMGSTWEPIKARGCSPIERIITVGDTEMVLQNLPPIKIWYGSTEQDQIVNKNYASRFVNAIINGGGYATYREVEGENHRICFGAVQYINNEYLYWINRFNN